MELKIEDVKVGDAVVNIESGLEYKIMGVNLNHQRLWLGGGNFILSENLKYFKKKEQSYGFDDLIDVARKAFNDGVINRYEVDKSYVSIKYNDGSKLYNKHYVKEGIEFIQSLYKETFVIECADDIKRIKKNAMIKLENENEVCAESDCINHGVNFISTTYGGCNFNLSFISLKGATVTQSK